MQRSTLPARLITIAVALILTPVALSLLTTGGAAWLFASYQFGDPTGDLGSLIGPILLQILAVLLLVGVVLTGIWSSAGLIAAGVLSVVPIALAVSPMLLPALFQAIPVEGTRQLLDSLSYGLPLFVLPVLGAMGAALAMVRLRGASSGGLGLSILGLLGAPVLLAVGSVLAAWGHGAGMLTALRDFRFDPNPAATLAVLGGVALIVAGVLLTRWSTFALVLPALFLLGLSAFVALPGSARWLYLPASPELSRAGPALLLLGAGVALAFVYLAFTAVLPIVRRSSRASLRVEPGVGHPVVAPAGAYPPAPPAQYPPAPPVA